MKFLLVSVIVALCFLLQVQCSIPPTPPKSGLIAVFVNALGGGSAPVSGITVDLLQTNETRLTDSTGVAVFQVNPGTYTIRVHDLQGGGPALHTIDSTISVAAGQSDTLKFFDCLICR